MLPPPHEQVGHNIHNPCDRIYRANTVDRLAGNLADRCKQDASEENGIVLHRIGMGCFIAFQSVELLSSDFAILDSLFSKPSKVFSWIDVVIEPVSLFECA